jgi:hypothetical protein
MDLSQSSAGDQMPADEEPYKTVEMSPYSEEFAKQNDKQIIEQIEAARKEIAAHPYSPEGDCELLPSRDTTRGPKPLRLDVTVWRLRIKTNGLEVSYTVREYERVVCLEKLYRPLKYRIKPWQPVVKKVQHEI